MWNKRRKQQPKMPPWIFWGALIFIAIILFGESRQPSPDQPSMLAAHLEDIKQDLPNIEQYKQFIPNRSGMKLSLIDHGSHIPVMCGQSVTISYQLFDKNKPISDPKTQIINTQKPENELLHYMASGATVGSKRRLDFESEKSLKQLFPEATEDALVNAVEATILTATPDAKALFDNEALALQLNDKVIGKSMTARCGDTVKIRMNLWSATGEKLFSNVGSDQQEISFTIGKNQLMLGIEQGVIGMSAEGSRNIILPPVWQHAAAPDSTLPAALKTAKPNVQIAEIMRVE